VCIYMDMYRRSTMRPSRRRGGCATTRLVWRECTCASMPLCASSAAPPRCVTRSNSDAATWARQVSSCAWIQYQSQSKMCVYGYLLRDTLRFGCVDVGTTGFLMCVCTVLCTSRIGMHVGLFCVTRSNAYVGLLCEMHSNSDAATWARQVFLCVCTLNTSRMCLSMGLFCVTRPKAYVCM